MNVEVEKLQKALALAEKLRDTLKEVAPLIESAKEIPIITAQGAQTERFVRASDAAEILGVGKKSINSFVKAGLLKPYYVNSEQRRFKLSDVYALAKENPWTIETTGDDSK